MTKQSRIWITLLPVIAVMVAIFCFSAQPADESSRTSDVIVDKVITTVVSDFDTLPSASKTDIKDFITVIVRKSGHFSEFALLGFFMLLHVSSHIRPEGGTKKRLFALILCAACASTDEIHQIFVEGRCARLTDVLIDSAGALVGILIMQAVLYFIGKHRKTRKSKELSR